MGHGGLNTTGIFPNTLGGIFLKKKQTSG